MMTNVFLSLMSGNGLVYGNLVEKFPSLTFTQINTIRQRNYTIVKSAIELGRPLNLPPLRLELYIPDTATRIKSANITINGTSKDLTKIILYPFVPQYAASSGAAQRVFIEPRYGDVHNISNVSISTDHRPLFETYTCRLKDGGVSNAVKILGTVRDEFWDEMTVGKNVFYGWTFSELGEVNTIDSIDEVNSIIYLTNNISGSVASDTEGSNVKFGTYFKDDVNEEDYIEYGEFWLVNHIHTEILYGVPVASSGTDYVLNLDECIFENAISHVSLSMGSMKVNINGDTTFKNGITPFSMFARNLAGGQRLTVDASAILKIEGAGALLGGAVTIAEPSGNYGSGGYLHDSIIVKCYGTLELRNNTSASWRQYSSSYGPATGETSFYENILESGSVEYAFLMSNTMPTEINYIEASGSILLRHDTTINGGILNLLQNSGVDFGIGNRTIEVNSVSFNFNANAGIKVDFFYNAEFNNCTYKLKRFSQLQVLISHCAINNTTINGGEITDADGLVDGSNEGSRFIQANRSNLLTIDGIVVPNENFYFLTTTAVQQPYYERTRRTNVINTNVQALYCVDGISIAGTVSNVLEGTNVQLTKIITQHQGKGLLANIKGLTGTTSKSILSSASYTNIGSLDNVLEVDFSNTVYETNGTIEAIIAKIGTNTSANPQYGNNIILRAVGGDILLKTFDASLRPKSNLIGINDTLITEGNELELTINRPHIFKTGTTNTTQLIGTGNGVVTEFKGVLSQLLLDPDEPINLVAGSIDLNADPDGVFDDVDVIGFVDAYTGKYQFIFTTPPASDEPINLTFNYPNTWLNTGAWEF